MTRLNQKAAAYSLRGSITVFASLSLLLVASFLLTLLEGARVEGLAAYAAMHRVNALESAFSEYERELFDRYGVFLLDGGYGTGSLQLSTLNGRLQEVSQKNLRAGSDGTQDFFQMDVSDASVSTYLLATDYEGAPFRAMAAAAMKAGYPVQLAQSLYEGLTDADRAMSEASASSNAMENAQSSLEEAKKEKARRAQSEDGEAEEQTEPVADPPENPIETIKKLKKKDLLSMVLPAGAQVSERTVELGERLEHRSLQQGNEVWQDTSDWYETILYQKFLQNSFSCYTRDVSDGRSRALFYELEYMIGGKGSDRENLKAVAEQLLLIREGANFIYLQTDGTKKAEAYELATALASAFALPALIPVLAQGILAAWAYAESVLDVRTLLAGGKIPWMKTSESWSSSLSGLGSQLAGTATARENEQGEDYAGYLEKLLYLKAKKTQNYRAMDLMELNVRLCENPSFRMDDALLTAHAAFTFETQPLFSSMVTIQRLQADKWEFTETEEYSYLPDGT